MSASLYVDGDDGDDDEIFVPVTIYLIYRMALYLEIAKELIRNGADVHPNSNVRDVIMMW